MLAKIQIRIVYLVVATVVSLGSGIGIAKGYDSFMSIRHPERHYYGSGVTLTALCRAHSEKDAQAQASAIREALATDRAEYGTHGYIAFINEHPFDKKGEELYLKLKGFSPTLRTVSMFVLI
jgi:hypothetical protein